MRHKLYWIAACLGLALAPHAHGYLGDLLKLPPHADYQVFDTEHFTLIYPSATRKNAEKLAAHLEDAHRELVPYFDYDPGARTKVILADNQEYANGVASPIGSQGLVLFLPSPDPYLSIGEYDQWQRNLVFHEYTHYLSLSQRRGIFAFAKILFGDLIYPNLGWPTWLAEGLAVYVESAFSRQGRGYGPLYATLTRDAIYRGTLGTREFLGYSRLNGPVPHYPFGESAYYAGFGIVSEMSRQLGPKAIARLSEEGSWRIPYFLDGTLSNVSSGMGKPEMGMQSLWKDWVAGETARLAPEINWLRAHAAHGARDPEFLTAADGAAIAPRFSPNERFLAYTWTSSHQRPGVMVLDLRDHRTTRVEDALTGGATSWSTDGRALFFAQSTYDGPFTLRSDLYRVEFDPETGATGSSRRLTSGERAKDPSDCGAALVYTSESPAGSELRLLDLGSNASRTLFRAPQGQRVASPRCSRDKKRVYFSMHGQEPHYAIYEIAVEGSNEAKRLVGGPADGFSALYPEPYGNDRFYFTRAIRGHFELARWDGKKAVPVARLPGGIWAPSVGPVSQESRVAVSYVTSTGVRAATLDAKALEGSLGAETAKAPFAEPAAISAVEKSSARPSAPAPLLSEARDYSVFSSLLPRVWSPYLNLTEDYSQLGGLAFGWDDTDQLEYTALAYYDTLTKSPHGSLGTFHRVSGFRLRPSVSSLTTSSLVTASGRRLYDVERKFGFSISRPLPGVFRSLVPSATVQWARTYRGGDFGTRTFSPELRLNASLSYTDEQQFLFSTNTESGTRVTGDVLRIFAGPDRAWKALVRADQTFSVWPRHSALSFRAFGGLSPSPTVRVPESYLKIGGRGTLEDLDLPLRGYPLGNFEALRAAVAAVEYRVPFWQIFTGLGNWPLFFRNLSVFGFYEGAKIRPASDGPSLPWMPALGGGLILNTVLGYQAPFGLRLEYARGLRSSYNGQDTLMLSFEM